MIRFMEEQQVFWLDTPNTSYVIGISDGKYVGHIYYGRRIEGGNLRYLLREEEPPFLPSGNAREKVSFLDSFPMEYSFGGTGDFRESCIDIMTEEGQQGLELWYVSHSIYQGKKHLEGMPATWGETCDTLEIVTKDAVTGIEAVLSYSVFTDMDVITRSVRVRNTGEAPVWLNRVLSACIDMEAEDFELLTLHGSWARERHMQYRDIGYGSLVTESLRGESGHQDHPFLGLVSKDCTQTSGQAYAMHLVYSGNFLGKVQKNQFDRIRAVIGLHPEYFCWKLNSKESFQAPEAVLVYSQCGIGKMTRTFHDLYRTHLIRSEWKDRERPVLINNWEAPYFDFDTDKLLCIAREAAKAGIEMLVMDDGGFGHRDSDNSSLGDWYVDERKIKGGLRLLSDEIHELGLKFGIWFEPGMLYYSPQIWCSDDTDGVERLSIQEGTQLLYPLSAIGAHVSDCPNHATGRNTPFDTRAKVAMAGTFGYELDITEIPEADRKEISSQIALYKKYGSLIREGDYYRLASYRENHLYDCIEVVSKDKETALLTYVQVLAEPNMPSRRILLQ
ncbi:alpha-galactosidase, partial [Enterocloster clostridioformis]